MTEFSVSVSGIRTAMGRQDVTSNNLANLLTPGFKASRVDQVDIQSGGTRIDSVDVLFNQGPLEISDGQFHMAVQGNGFFQVNTPNGVRYTRAGTFTVDGQGRLVTPSGYPIDPGIQVPSDAVSVAVSPGGAVTAALSNGATQSLGQISLARFNNPAGLNQVGENLYGPGANSGNPLVGTPGTASFGSIAFGSLEGSNVDLAAEMVGTIMNRALLKANVTAVKVQDRMVGDLLDILG